MDAFCHKNLIYLETFCSDRKMRWIFLIYCMFHFVFRQLVKINDVSIGRKHRGRHLFWRTKNTTIIIGPTRFLVTTDIFLNAITTRSLTTHYSFARYSNMINAVIINRYHMGKLLNIFKLLLWNKSTVGLLAKTTFVTAAARMKPTCFDH